MSQKAKITKRVVDAAEVRPVRYVLFDSEIKGFGLRVFPSGQKSWIFEYKVDGGGRKAGTKRLTIGRSDEFTPDEARKLAEKLRAKAKVGQDPQSEKIAYRQAATVSDVVDTFLVHVGSKKRASTEALYRDILERLVKPVIGNRKAADIKRAELAKLHLDLSDTPYQANRTMAVLGSMYSFAGKHGLVPEGCNPARGIEKFDESSRERLLSADELVRLGDAIRIAETDGIPWRIDPAKKTKHVPKDKREAVIGPHAAAALRLLIFTGARLREILHLEWSQVDLERGLLLLPTSKTGKKTIVLNAPAMALLSNLERIGRYVIAGKMAGMEDEKPRADLKRPWAMVTRHAVLEDLRIHDLRHNFASFGAGGGLGLPIIGKLLGHTQAATTQRYPFLPSTKGQNIKGSAHLKNNHEDVGTGAILQMNSLAAAYPYYYDGVVHSLANISTSKGEFNEQKMDYLMSMVAGVKPRDQLESMLAVQMAAIHEATLEMAARIKRCDTIPQHDSAERSLNKLARTFTSQMEALKRYRSKGEQRVYVERVTVNEGGQAIVGPVSHGGGVEE